MTRPLPSRLAGRPPCRPLESRPLAPQPVKKLLSILLDTAWGPVTLWALAATLFVASVTLDVVCFDFHPLGFLLPFVLFVLPATVVAIAAFVRSIVLRHWGRAILQLGWGFTAFGYACIALLFVPCLALEIKYPMSGPPPLPSRSTPSSPSTPVLPGAPRAAPLPCPTNN